METAYSLSVANASDRIQRGELSSVDLLDSLLGRIDLLEPTLEAWVTVDREGALAAAEQRDRELAQGKTLGPLHGIPVGIKDIIYTAGLRTTAGSKIYADFVPGYDATPVARLKEAGAIILGKTVTTEFALSDPAHTRNPWNSAHAPGGSSTGSAVAVAARMCPAALGTQTGGSNNKPAAYNGIVGLKPTYGRISRYGVIPVSWSLDSVGILVRTVEDATIMLGALAGHDPHDASSSRTSVPNYRAALAKLEKPPRIGLLREFFLEQCNDEVRANTEEVAQRLSQAGASVEELKLPKSFADREALFGIITSVECAAYHQELIKENAGDYGPKVRSHVLTGMLVPGLHYVQAQRRLRRLREEMTSLASNVDALLVPSNPAPAPRDLDTVGDNRFQMPWACAGLPIVTIPSGLSKSGLPLGVMLAGPPFGEARLLAAASWCEAILDINLVPPEPSPPEVSGDQRARAR